MNIENASALIEKDGAGLLNIQYGVCFGVIFSQTFYALPSSSIEGHFDIVLLLPWSLLWPFSLLILYLFLDWLIANIVRKQVRAHLSNIFLWSVAIWTLGFVINVARVDGDDWNLYVGGYIAAVSVYHVLAFSLNVYRLKPHGALLLGLLVSVLTFLLGLLLVTSTLLPRWAGVPAMEPSDSASNWVVTSVAFLLLLKGIHLVILRYSPSLPERAI